MSKVPITNASVHPLVLLSIVDHYNRVNLKQRNKRVIGALLGTSPVTKGMSMMRMSRLSTATQFPSRRIPASPAFGFWITSFTSRCSTWWRRYECDDEDQPEGKVYWLVHDRWLLQGPWCSDQLSLQEVQRQAHLFGGRCRAQCKNKDIQNELGLPTQVFITQEEVNQKTGSVLKSFFHIESKVEATEPEEIGVEHLLREIKEIPLNSLESSIFQKVQALKGLEGKIQ